MTLTEVGHFFVSSGIIKTQEQFCIFGEVIKNFKDIGDNIIPLAVQFIIYTRGEFSTNMIKSLLNLLIKFGFEQRYMLIFDKVNLTSTHPSIHSLTAHRQDLEEMPNQRKYHLI